MFSAFMRLLSVDAPRAQARTDADAAPTARSEKTSPSVETNPDLPPAASGATPGESTTGPGAAIAPRVEQGERPSVPMRLFWDDPLREPITVQAPGAMFHWRDGEPVLEGPRVAVTVSKEVEPYKSSLSLLGFLTQSFVVKVDHDIELAAAEKGGFQVADTGTAIAQTTSFYGANQVIRWAERSVGHRIEWGTRGRLSIDPYGFIGTTPLKLNAYFMHGHRVVRLGSVATIEDGKLVPYTGDGLGFLEMIVDAKREELARIQASTERAPLGERDALEAQAKHLQEEIDVVSSTLRSARGETQPEVESEKGILGSLSGLFRGAQSLVLRFEASSITSSTHASSSLLVELGKSREVVAHEAGHAALAAIKPGLRTTAGRALHEAYGDLAAFATSLEDDATIDAVLEETGGDLTKSNRVSRVAEQFAQTVAQSTVKTDDDEREALRDINNDVKRTDFDGLDLDTTKGGGAPHTISKMISGAFYELFARTANERLAALGADATAAQKRAAVRETEVEVSRLLHLTVAYLPEDGGSFQDFTQALLRAGAASGGASRNELLKEILGQRELMPTEAEQVGAAEPASVPSLSLDPSATGSAIMAAVRSNGEVARQLASLGPKDAEGQFHVVSDDRLVTGQRVVRFQFRQERSASEIESARTTFGENWRDITDRHYVSFVFDADGKLESVLGNTSDVSTDDEDSFHVSGCTCFR